MRKTIVFDFDGVLVDSVSLKGSAFSKVLGIENRNVVQAIAQHHMANPSMGREDKLSTYMTKYRNHTKKGLSLSGALEEFSKIIVAGLASEGLMEGSLQFLDKVRNEYDLQISSSAPEAEIVEFLSNIGVLEYFSKVSGFPAKKHKFLSDCLKTSARVTFVGDSITDLIAARKAKVEFIGFRFDPHRRDIRIVNDYSKLYEVLSQMEER